MLNQGVLPRGSSAKDLVCVMRPVGMGTPKLIPCCLSNDWCQVACSYQTHLGRVLSRVT